MSNEPLPPLCIQCGAVAYWNSAMVGRFGYRLCSCTKATTESNGTGNGSTEKVEDVLAQILARLEAIEKELS